MLDAVLFLLGCRRSSSFGGYTGTTAVLEVTTGLLVVFAGTPAIKSLRQGSILLSVFSDRAHQQVLVSLLLNGLPVPVPTALKTTEHRTTPADESLRALMMSKARASPFPLSALSTLYSFQVTDTATVTNTVRLQQYVDSNTTGPLGQFLRFDFSVATQ